MRPIKLTLQAFGAFKDKIVISFEKLGEGNVYLITGATGSGKTTIFDAICYALFNSSSGTNRGNATLRSHYAQENIKSFVEFEFIYQGENYKITRFPSYERKKTRGEGVIVEQAQALIQLPDGKIIEKVNDVDEYIKELLGVNVSQFSQIALLAQGEFLKILNSDTQTRGEIFRNIFKTWDYANFQNDLKDKTLALKNKYENIKNSILQYVKDVNPLGEQLKELKESYISNVCFDNLDNFILLIENDCKKDNQTLKNIKEQIETIEAQININQLEFQKIQTKLNLENQKGNLEKELKDKENIFSKIKIDFLNLPKKKEELQANLFLMEKSNEEYKKAQVFQKLIKEKEDKEKLKEKTQKDLSSLKIEYLNLKYFKLEELKLKLEKNQKEFLNKQELTQNSIKNYEDLNLKYLQNQAGIIAKDLKENSPCPVCGSLSHPNPAKYDIKENLTQEFLEKEKEKTEENKEKLALLSQECSVLNEKIKQSDKEFKKLLVEYDVENTKITPKNNFKNEDEFEKEIKIVLDDLSQIILDLSGIDANICVIKKDLIDENIETILEKYSKLETLTNTIKKEIEDIEKNYNNINLEINELSSKIKLINEQLKDYSKIFINKEELEEKIENFKNEIIALDKQIEKIIERKSINEKTLISIEKQNKDFIEIEEKYCNYKILSDCANGNLKGKARIAFEQYIQGYYLDLVLYEANKRLKIMTQNQFQLMRKKEATTLQSKTGLELEVMDFHTFKKRSTKTLSGGESFKASLALALGLSDCISNFSKGVNLDSLFIDEGFGTLDSESLELAMDVILNLSNNKLIGIISHIDELKNKIQNQIQTIKTDNGSKAEINF